jgi:outer membrane protein OmpA-like peptidoglycan-associated protein
MRPLPILSAIILTAATPVFAQVTVDLHALQALPDNSANRRLSHSVPPSPNRPAVVMREAPPGLIREAPSDATRGAPSTAPAPPSQVPSGSPSGVPSAATPAPRPELPENVPDTATITPITPPEPASGAQPPPPPPVSDTATTAAAPTTAGLRLTFAPGASDLSPESSTSIKQLTQAAPAGDATTTFNVLAYAPGKPDDPSTARRVSLSRAMAVRSALVSDGVPSARIFVRALGEQYGDGPPDRVDLSITGANVPTDTATSR